MSALDEVTEDMRRLAKTTNFGIVYGISAQGLASRTEFTRSGGGDVHRDVFRDVSGREDLHGLDHRRRPRAGLRGDAVSAAAVSAGAQFAGVSRAGGGRADGDQHADPGHDRRTS